MIERPILFSGEMVRAILEGRKTITRRVMKPQPNPITNGPVDHNKIYTSGWFEGKSVPKYVLEKCPYGQTGDRLWCKETWAWSCGLDNHENCDRGCIKYRADEEYTGEFGLKWQSSRFMPKRASRIMLEITNIRVERLQEISEEDAYLEGVVKSLAYMKETPDGIENYSTYRAGFQKLWDSINGKNYSWDSNPWVFAIFLRGLTNEFVPEWRNSETRIAGCKSLPRQPHFERKP